MWANRTKLLVAWRSTGTFFRKPEGFFLITALIFGLLMIKVTPPMQSPDENMHFWRSYQLSNFNLFPDKQHVYINGRGITSTGGVVPDNIITFANDFLFQTRTANHEPSKVKREVLNSEFKYYADSHVDFKNARVVLFPNTAIYSPANYLPQTLSIWFGKAFNLRILTFYYLGRILSLLFWLVLIFVAIKILPVGKWAMVALALIPVQLFQASTFSADSSANALAFLTTAIFVSMAMGAIKLSKKNLTFVIIAVGLLSLCKSDFWPFALLFWFLPIRRFASRKQYLLANSMISGSAIIAWVWWYEHIKFAVPFVASFFLPGVNVNSSQQLAQILGAPVHFVYLLLKTLFSTATLHQLGNGFGNMGWDEAPIPKYAMAILLLILIYQFLLLALDEKTTKYKTVSRLGSVFVFTALIVMMMSTLYLVMSPVGGHIDGIQGRYYLPIMVLLIPMSAGLVHKYKNKFFGLRRINEFITMLGTSFVLIQAILALYSRYYG